MIAAARPMRTALNNSGEIVRRASLTSTNVVPQVKVISTSRRCALSERDTGKKFVIDDFIQNWPLMKVISASGPAVHTNPDTALSQRHGRAGAWLADHWRSAVRETGRSR